MSHSIPILMMQRRGENDSELIQWVQDNGGRTQYHCGMNQFFDHKEHPLEPCKDPKEHILRIIGLRNSERNQDGIIFLGDWVLLTPEGTFVRIYSGSSLSVLQKYSLDPAPRKFVSNPVEIEAIQRTGKNEDEVLQFLEKGATYSYENIHEQNPTLKIETLEGMMECPIGWWIIRGIEGEFYPCKDSVFKKKYSEAR